MFYNTDPKCLFVCLSLCLCRHPSAIIWAFKSCLLILWADDESFCFRCNDAIASSFKALNYATNNVSSGSGGGWASDFPMKLVSFWSWFFSFLTSFTPSQMMKNIKKLKKFGRFRTLFLLLYCLNMKNVFYKAAITGLHQPAGGSFN